MHIHKIADGKCAVVTYTCICCRQTTWYLQYQNLHVYFFLQTGRHSNDIATVRMPFSNKYLWTKHDSHKGFYVNLWNTIVIQTRLVFKFLNLKTCKSINLQTTHTRVATLMHKQIPWLFPDQIQFFTDQNTALLPPICLLAADKWQILFTSSLKCTSRILQMKQIKSLNSFFAQNVLKFTSFHSFQ